MEVNKRFELPSLLHLDNENGHIKSYRHILGVIKGDNVCIPNDKSNKILSGKSEEIDDSLFLRFNEK